MRQMSNLQLPPPMGARDVHPRMAAVETPAIPEDKLVHEHDVPAQSVVARVYDHLLRSQHQNAERHVHLVDIRKPGWGANFKL